MIRARYSVISIPSPEEERVLDLLHTWVRGTHQHIGEIKRWTATRGLLTYGKDGGTDEDTRAPADALQEVLNEDADRGTLFVFCDLDEHIERDPRVRRLVRDCSQHLRGISNTLILLSPQMEVHEELEKDVAVVDFPLPSREEIRQVVNRNLADLKKQPGDFEVDDSRELRDEIVQACTGLTEVEAEDALARAVIECQGLKPGVVDSIQNTKREIIKKSAALEFVEIEETMDSVGGLDQLKGWFRKRKKVWSEEAREFGVEPPKGVLTMGIPGGGKGLSAKAAAHEWHLPLLRLDMGAVFGGLVGQSEGNLRQALKISEAIAPCVTGDTQVTLASGEEVPIKELYEGEQGHLEVLAMNDDMELEPTPVRAITRRKAPDLYKITLQHGELKTTGNHEHPVLRDGQLEWVRADALEKGDFVALPRTIPTQRGAVEISDFLPGNVACYFDGALQVGGEAIPEGARRSRQYRREFVYLREAQEAQTEAIKRAEQFVLSPGGYRGSVLPQIPYCVTRQLGRLLGMLHSDGYLAQNDAHRVGFVNTDERLHDEFSRLLKELFGIKANQVKHPDKEKTSALDGLSDEPDFSQCTTTFVDNKFLHLLLEQLSEALLTFPAEVLWGWLSGYIDGDGSLDKQEADYLRITLCSKTEKGRQQLRGVLQRLGLPATRAENSYLTITGWRRTARALEQLSLKHPQKEKRRQAWLEKFAEKDSYGADRDDRVPAGKLLRQARLSVGMSSDAFEHASSSLVHRYEHDQGAPSRERLLALIDEMRQKGDEAFQGGQALQQLEKLATSSMGWSQVQEVVEVDPPQYVYDLACVGHHNFVANGFVTHNCLLWVDEVEKGLSGMASSGQTDSGTTARVFATFLTWLQEKDAPVFVYFTANDISKLPPELLRKGRVDELFFIGLPDDRARREILSIHLRKRGRDPEQFDMGRLSQACEQFVGAEIEQGIKEALVDAFSEGASDIETRHIIEAFERTVPLVETQQQNLARLFKFVRDGRARRASSGELIMPDDEGFHETLEGVDLNKMLEQGGISATDEPHIN